MDCWEPGQNYFLCQQDSCQGEYYVLAVWYFLIISAPCTCFIDINRMFWDTRQITKIHKNRSQSSCHERLDTKKLPSTNRSSSVSVFLSPKKSFSKKTSNTWLLPSLCTYSAPPKCSFRSLHSSSLFDSDSHVLVRACSWHIHILLAVQG
jgi:hypothetical protein